MVHYTSENASQHVRQKSGCSRHGVSDIKMWFLSENQAYIFMVQNYNTNFITSILLSHWTNYKDFKSRQLKNKLKLSRLLDHNPVISQAVFWTAPMECVPTSYIEMIDIAHDTIDRGVLHLFASWHWYLIVEVLVKWNEMILFMKLTSLHPLSVWFLISCHKLYHRKRDGKCF